VFLHARMEVPARSSNTDDMAAAYSVCAVVVMLCLFFLMQPAVDAQR